MKTLLIVLISMAATAFVACQSKTTTQVMTDPNIMADGTKKGNPYYSHTDTTPLHLSDAEWKKVLSDDVYAVSRKAETERPFTGKYYKTDVKGTYYCAACGSALFRSDDKFASSCGWPSFFEQLRKSSVVYKDDSSYGMQRIEALCGRCGGHLGHLFDDGPAPTGKRYCMNSVAMDFEPDK